MSRKQETIVTFEVRLTLPTGSNTALVEEYVRNAVTGWKGEMDPEHPMSNLDRDQLVVKLKEKRTTYA